MRSSRRYSAGEQAPRKGRPHAERVSDHRHPHAPVAHGAARPPRAGRPAGRGGRVAEGARGVKLLPLQHWFHGDDRRLWPMYEYLEAMGLPVLSQSGAGGPASPITGDAWGRPLPFGAAAAAFPKLNFILAHFG